MDITVQQIMAGDRKAFQDCYTAYHARLYQYIYKYTRSEWLAEETVQLSFIKIWEKRAQLSPEHTISIQLFRVAKSMVIDLMRKSSVRQVYQLGADLDDAMIADNNGDDKEALAHVMKVIRSLPAVQQQVFSYSRIEDLSHKEIAEKLSISTKTVETHITRAMKRIRQTLSSLLSF